MSARLATSTWVLPGLVAMVNKEVVLETIKKMHDSGIEQSVIEATLRDIGLKDEEIKQYIAEVTDTPPASTPEPQSDAIAQKAADKIKEHLAEEKEARELNETAQHNAIEAQHGKIEEVGKQVGEIHEKVSTMAGGPTADLIDKLDVLEKRIGGIEKKIDDIKAINTATKDLMEKVLEVNRKTLSKL